VIVSSVLSLVAFVALLLMSKPMAKDAIDDVSAKQVR
jgi:hypothetical protein